MELPKARVPDERRVWVNSYGNIFFFFVGRVVKVFPCVFVFFPSRCSLSLFEKLLYRKSVFMCAPYVDVVVNIIKLCARIYRKDGKCMSKKMFRAEKKIPREENLKTISRHEKFGVNFLEFINLTFHLTAGGLSESIST